MRPVLRPFTGAIGGVRRVLPWSKKKSATDVESSDDEGGFFEDLQHDEERKIRRFGWRWWRRRTTTKPTGGGVAQAMAAAGKSMALRPVGTGLSGVGGGDGVINGGGKEEAGIDLEQLIEAARAAPPGEGPYGLEVHPGTDKSDPVISREVLGGGQMAPPSQNWEVRRWLGVGGSL